MTYIRRIIAAARAVRLPLVTLLGTLATVTVAHAQAANAVQSYSHQIHEVVVTTPSFSATYHVLVTPPEAVDPSLPGFDVIADGYDEIFRNEPEIISDEFPLIAANEPEIISDNEPEIISDQSPELVTTEFVHGREYWFLASTGDGDATPTASWELLLDRVGNEPEIISYVRDLVANEAYLGSLPTGGRWAPAAPALLATSGWSFLTLDAVSGDGHPAVAINNMTFAVSVHPDGTPQIPFVFTSGDMTLRGTGASSSSSDYVGLTAPAMMLFGLLNPVDASYSYVPPSMSEGQTLEFVETTPAGPGEPDMSWFNGN